MCIKVFKRVLILKLFCNLQKELEILLFLMIVVMIRTRKAGSVTMIAYLSSSFIYTKAANLLLWFYADVRYGFLFTAIVVGMFNLCIIFVY